MKTEDKKRWHWPNTGIDMLGRVVGDLTVVRAGPSDNQRRYWVCRCTCGKEKVLAGQRLRRGDVTHCGCKGRRKPGTSETHTDFDTARQAAAFADLDAAWGRMWTVLRDEAPRQDHS
jgi:hypothetical protein